MKKLWNFFKYTKQIVILHVKVFEFRELKISDLKIAVNIELKSFKLVLENRTKADLLIKDSICIYLTGEKNRDLFYFSLGKFWLGKNLSHLEKFSHFSPNSKSVAFPRVKFE